MSPVIPLILPVSNAIALRFLEKDSPADIAVLSFYGLMLLLSLFFNVGLVKLARSYLYRFLPYTLIWALLSLVYFIGPLVYSASAVYRLNNKEKYEKQIALLLAYFSVVYILLHVRVSSNWQVIESCA
jgi:GH24 family phage-related lysozyme (muramidase)